MSEQRETAAHENLDPAEVERFARIANEWWDASGKFAPLHRLGPARMEYLRNRLTAHFGRTLPAAKPLDGLRILDIGCGGGLVSEPLSRLGATVTGIDPAADNIEAARAHADISDLEIDYRCATAEEIAEGGEQFDAVL